MYSSYIPLWILFILTHSDQHDMKMTVKIGLWDAANFTWVMGLTWIMIVLGGGGGGHPCLVYHKLTNYLQLFDDMVEGCCNFTYMHALVSLCTFQLQSVCERCPLLKSLSWAHLGPAKCRTYNLQQWCIGDLNFYVLFITAFPNSVVVDDGSSGREVYDSLDTTSCYTVCNWERKSYRALGCLL